MSTALYKLHTNKEDFMKKLWVLLLVLVMTFSMTACGESDTGDQADTGSKDDMAAEEIELSMMVNFQSSEPVVVALQEAIDGFMAANPNIKVILTPGTSDYEALMKTKMATNDLPDLWSTHGWSVMRYSEYLLPIEDQAWVSDLHPSIEPVITNNDGQIFVLPMDVDVAGIAYNKDVLIAAGVDIAEVKTWDQFYDAMEAVKNSGVTPIHMGGKDNWTVGAFFDWLAPSLYITDETRYKGDELLAGTFDTDVWTEGAELCIELADKGYLNVDMLTSGFSDSARSLAEGSSAFVILGNYVITEALTYNADANLGFFPVPAYYEGDEPSLISGERTAIGIWKDSPNKEAAKQLLTYLAQPDVMAKVATANGVPAGLTTATADTGILKDSYEQWQDVEAFPYFDRAFLPSGMWDTMCTTGTGALSGEMTPEEVSQQMLSDFNKLYNQ